MSKYPIKIKDFSKLVLLEGKPEFFDGLVVYSPICPDYHFKEIRNPYGESERIHDFIVGRAGADLERYLALGAGCRRKGYTIADATAPEVARYYNEAGDKYPVTPYIRIVDNYE